MFFFCVFLVFFFYLLNFFASLKNMFAVGVVSFESGFFGVGVVQRSFSVHFFLIMLLFIIFDLEVIMLVGALVGDFFCFFNFFLVFFFMLGGLYVEWFFNKLLWFV